MGDEIRIGDDVEWTWGDAAASGDVVERFAERVTRTIKGTEVTRNADEEEPAYLIRQEDGQEVLKSASELRIV